MEMKYIWFQARAAAPTGGMRAPTAKAAKNVIYVLNKGNRIVQVAHSTKKGRKTSINTILMFLSKRRANPMRRRTMEVATLDIQEWNLLGQYCITPSKKGRLRIHSPNIISPVRSAIFNTSFASFPFSLSLSTYSCYLLFE